MYNNCFEVLCFDEDLKMTFQQVGVNDVAGVTSVCNNLQILYTSKLQFCTIETVHPFQEKMPNRCAAAGCSNVPDPSKSVGLHEFPEDNDLKKKKETLDCVCVKKMCEMASHRYILPLYTAF